MATQLEQSSASVPSRSIFGGRESGSHAVVVCIDLIISCHASPVADLGKIVDLSRLKLGKKQMSKLKLPKKQQECSRKRPKIVVPCELRLARIVIKCDFSKKLNLNLNYLKNAVGE